MEFQPPKPIYLQIADRLMEQILLGSIDTEARVPSVRDVAVQMGVNPNTVMRSFEWLQQQGIIYVQRGNGHYVAVDAATRIHQLWRQQFLSDELPRIKEKIKLLGISPEVFTD